MDLAPAAPAGIALLGLLMGMRHATDLDHVVAVTTIVSRERSLITASRIGVVWGLGHTLTVLAVGALIIIFKITLPPRLGLALEFAVGLVLLLLGASATARLGRRILRRRSDPLLPDDAPLMVHAHTHTHGGRTHRHPHAHRGGDVVTGAANAFHERHTWPHDASARFAVRRPLLRAFAVGLVHGLAGSAAIALVVLAAIPAPLWAVLYLGVFCLGTILGMGLITTAIAAPLMVVADRVSWVHRSLVTGSGLVSFAFGLLVVYQVGVVDGLFAATPAWTPH